jgi:SNF2 family DNA or RNA helicase
MSIEGAADREYAHNAGRDRRDSAWILSDRDVWYRNPFYRGPPQPHPEDEQYDYDEDMIG